MKIFKKSLLVVAMACISVSASAGITSWMDSESSSNTTRNNEQPTQVAPPTTTPPPSQVAPRVTPKPTPTRTETAQPAPIRNINTSQVSNNRNVTASPLPNHINHTNNSEEVFTPTASDLQKEKLLTQYMARTQSITSSPEVTALKSEDYLAAVMLNGALVQAGMDYLSGEDSGNTQGMYNKAIGCINTRNKPELTRVAQEMIAKHYRITNVSKTVNLGPRLGSGYKVACQ